LDLPTGNLQLRLAAVHALARLGESVDGNVDLMIHATVHADAAGWQKRFGPALTRPVKVLRSAQPGPRPSSRLTRRQNSRQSP
jgi:hypothetical protein